MHDIMQPPSVRDHIRLENGAEMTAKLIRVWLASVGAKHHSLCLVLPGKTAIAQREVAQQLIGLAPQPMQIHRSTIVSPLNNAVIFNPIRIGSPGRSYD